MLQIDLSIFLNGDNFDVAVAAYENDHDNADHSMHRPTHKTPIRG